MDIHDSLEYHAANTAREHRSKVVSEDRAVRKSPILDPGQVLLLARLELLRGSSTIARHRALSLLLSKLVDLVDDLNHVPRHAGRGHVAVDVGAALAEAPVGVVERSLAPDDLEAAGERAEGALLDGGHST